MSKTEAATSSTVVTGTLFLNSKPFYALFESSATLSFISRSSMQLNLDDRRTKTNYSVKVPIDTMIECPMSDKLVSITIGGATCLVDLIQFYSSNLISFWE